MPVLVQCLAVSLRCAWLRSFIKANNTYFYLRCFLKIPHTSVIIRYKNKGFVLYTSESIEFTRKIFTIQFDAKINDHKIKKTKDNKWYNLDETESEKVKEKILAKCKQYLERAEKIAEYLNS